MENKSTEYLLGLLGELVDQAFIESGIEEEAPRVEEKLSLLAHYAKKGKELFASVKDMRTDQKQYFSDRTRFYLDRSKRAEKEVDRLINAWGGPERIDPENQPPLF